MAKIINTKKELEKHKDKIINCINGFGFIPQKLQIKDKPELDVFPLNIMFMNYRYYYGRLQSGVSLYEPALQSYEDIIDMQRLMYCNIYNPENKIIIVYYPENGKYVGYKYINGKCVQEACGPDWKLFFIHLTIIGPLSGERCKFKFES